MNPIIFLILIGAFNCALSVDLSPKVLTAEQANSGVVLIPSLSAIESNSSELVPVANVEGQISTESSTDCPSFENAESLSQTKLFKRLVDPCRFDRLQRPTKTKNLAHKSPPVDVYLRAYIYYIRNSHAHNLQFQIQALLQLRYVDPRLVFKQVALNRSEPIIGEGDFRNQLWLPHIFFANERESAILGTQEKDILTSISPDGTVIISARIQTTLLCSMNLRRFPFDQQHCHTLIESWMYNSSDVKLHWEPQSPVTIDRPDEQLTEFALVKSFYNESVVNADLKNLRHGAFTGFYSVLSFSIVLNRQSGFYLLDYFLPSMMIVAISWVSFWIQGDQGAPRVMLGTATLLTFITLASAQDKTLPKVSYVKATEIWFMGCTTFIVASLLEFAFVNTIWRQKKHMEFKEVTAKRILASAIRKGLEKKQFGVSPMMHRANSLSSVEEENEVKITDPDFKNIRSSFRSSKNLKPDQIDEDYSYSNKAYKNDTKNAKDETKSQDSNEVEPEQPKQAYTTVTPKQISMYIDRQSRYFFPLAFLTFNIMYWTFVLAI